MGYSRCTHHEYHDVVCSLWQGNNIVAMMSTLHLGDQYETRLRRQPRDTSSSAVTGQLPFIRWGAVLIMRKLPVSYRRPLPIPKHGHDYNCFMNGCDIEGQLRARFKIQWKTNRPWWPSFYFLLHYSIINAYLLRNWHTKEAGNPLKLKSHHLRFRSDLVDALLWPPTSRPPNLRQ